MSGMRVSDELVRRFLTWARNYGEIESFEQVTQAGRKWLVRLPKGTTVTVDGSEVGWLTGADGIVPDEMVLTSREALVFGYGLAIGGGRPETRRAIAAREWGWDDDTPSTQLDVT
jgi:hypothetical protein